MAYGETDEWGYYAVKDKVHMHDLHATLLHLLGLEHTRLTYRHAGPPEVVLESDQTGARAVITIGSP